MRPLRVTVLGGLNMDLIVRVPHLPRPGETTAGQDLLRAPGGKGGNQAVAAARLGAEVTMIGRVGNDAFGDELRDSLREAGVSTRWVAGCERPTGAALIMVDEHGENSIAVAAGANQTLAPNDIAEDALRRAEVVAASLEVPVAAIDQAFRVAKRFGVKTVLNAAPARTMDGSVLALADVLIVNELELATLLGHQVSPGGEVAGARALGSAGQVVVVTLGERGAVAIVDDAQVEQPGFKVGTVDTVGAGDAFVGGFVVGRWFAAGVAESLRWGCAAGALATTRQGAQPAMPTRDEVRSLVESS
jgi:ribokinase